MKIKKIIYIQGFATLEIIIALSIIVITISAITLVSFSSQTILVDSLTSNDALSFGKQVMNSSEFLARKDFKLVQPFSTSSFPYTTTVNIDSSIFYTKKITAVVTWAESSLRPQHITLQKILTDVDSETDDTCDSVVSGDWLHPTVKNNPTDFGNIISDPSHIYSISDVDVFMKHLYVTVDATTNKTDSTFYILGTTNPAHLQLISSLDNAPTTISGINAMVISSSNAEIFAYVLNAIPSNFSTCSPGKNCAQLQIINVTNPLIPTIISNYKIPATSTPFVTGSNNKAVGQSIFYSNGYVYVGLSKTITGPEFNIIDVHDPVHPQWVGGFNIGYSIYSIFIKNNFAYIAHSTDSAGNPQEQLTVLDVHIPTNPQRISGFYDTPGLFNIGKSISMVGDTTYFGRLASKTLSGPTDTIPEFYILHNNETNHIMPIALSTTSLSTPESLHGIIVRNTNAFFVTSSQFQIWNIANLSHIFLLFSLSIPSGGVPTPSFDCEKNNFYIGSNNSSDRGYISIIGTDP